jgi:hypothetical protein
MAIWFILLLLSSLNVGLFFLKKMRTFDVSCKIILDEVVNKLPVIGLKFDTCCRYGDFFSDVHASLPDLEAHIKLRQLFTSSRQEYIV